MRPASPGMPFRPDREHARRMSAFALALVLSSAFLHAIWNALVKAAGDRAATLAAVSLMHVLAGLVLVLIAPLPARESWPSLLASTILHYGYYYLLFHAYRLGDLSQVYPISRGMAPALVAVGAFLLADEALTPAGWGAIAAVSAGIGLLAVQRGAAHADPLAIGVAATLGLTIAAYSVADGIGVRLAGNPLSYMGWLFLLETPVIAVILLPRWRNGHPVDWSMFRRGLLGGLLAVAAYGVVLYAATIAPIAAVSAVRESSVVMAALIGVLLFGERPWRGRIAAASIVAAGVTTLAWIG